MAISRRRFLQGCSAAIVALYGGRLTRLGFLNPTEAATGEILVVVFLRGGCDGMSLVPPYSEARYHDLRPNIRIPEPGSGDNAAFDLDGQFGLHPAAAPLYDLYQQQHLAVVHACGLTSDTRSHFEAMDYMERGTPDVEHGNTGWLTRHLLSSATEGQLPAVAANSLVPTSLLGSTEAVGIERLGDFNFNGHWRWEDAQRLALRYMYNGDTWLHQAGEQTLNAIDVVELANPGSYIPDHDAVYPDSDFGDALQILAQLIKLDVGLHVATVDLGGWDTHEHQGDQGTGYFASQVQGLAEGLAAFYTDLLDYSQRLTVVVMSEFGRRLRENGNHGTDHGHGNVVLVLGGNVNGGQVFVDPWPGLERSQLDNGVDLAITIDYRRVLSEILVRRMQNPRLGMVFPGYTDYTPLGIVSGPDLPIDYDNSINIVDIQKAAACFGIAEGNCAQWDLDASGAVDAGDLQELADRWEPSAL